MFTIFSIPKAFKGDHTDVIQRNAVQSWIRLHPDVQVFLCADDPGVKEVAEELGVGYIPDVERNEFGTPLVRSAFDKVREVARYDKLCFVNADIILLNDFTDAVRRVEFDDYLMVGQRWDVPITKLWDYDHPNWEGTIRQFTEEQGRLHIPAGSDYFVFPRNSAVVDLPPFAVGRPGWDCWLIYYARKQRLPVVDMSLAVTVLHQNHDYGHVPKSSGGTTTGFNWKGPEAEAAAKIVSSTGHYFDLIDASHIMTPRSIHRPITYIHLRQRWYRIPIFYPRFSFLFAIGDKLVSKLVGPVIRMMLPRRAPKPEVARGGLSGELTSTTVEGYSGEK